jgi:hypothetical protein
VLTANQKGALGSQWVLSVVGAPSFIPLFCVALTWRWGAPRLQEVQSVFGLGPTANENLFVFAAKLRENLQERICERR